MYLPIGKAAEAVKVSRATLYKRNKEGKLSFHNDERGQKVIDMAELSRLYKLYAEGVTNSHTSNHYTSKKEGLPQELWQVKLDAAQEKIMLLERHINHLQNMLLHEQSHVTKLLSTSEQLLLTQEQKPKTLIQKIKGMLR